MCTMSAYYYYCKLQCSQCQWCQNNQGLPPLSVYVTVFSNCWIFISRETGRQLAIAAVCAHWREEKFCYCTPACVLCVFLGPTLHCLTIALATCAPAFLVSPLSLQPSLLRKPKCLVPTSFYSWSLLPAVSQFFFSHFFLLLFFPFFVLSRN